VSGAIGGGAGGTLALAGGGTVSGAASFAVSDLLVGAVGVAGSIAGGDAIVHGLSNMAGNSSGGELQEFYNSIIDSPNYPQGFKAVKNGTRSNTINNKSLLEKLRQKEPGTWKKVYKDGYDALGNKVSIHYFQSESGTVFNVKVKPRWSNH